MHEATLIELLLREGGKIAMDYYRKVKPAMKGNKTYVTEADLKVQDFLMKRLEREFPHDGFIGEEQNLSRKPSGDSKTSWVFDPIDGTAAFVHGFSEWGISIAKIRSGEPVSGYFYMPASNDLYSCTDRGDVLRNNEHTKLIKPKELYRESVLLTVSRMHQRYRIMPTYPGKIRSLGSTVAHLCYVATGSAHATLLGRVHLWDIAAGLAMLMKNGGELRYMSGLSVSLSDLMTGEPAREPMLAGHASMIDRYLSVINEI